MTVSRSGAVEADAPDKRSETGATTGGYRSNGSLTVAHIGLAVFAGVAVLYLGREILMPAATAVVLGLVLRPACRRLNRWRIPYPVSALGLVLSITAVFGAAAYGLKEPAAQWLREAPGSLRLLEYRVLDFKRSIAEVREATQQVGHLGEVGDEREQQVIVQKKDLPGQLFAELQEATAGVFTALLMLFFILGWGDRLYRNLVNALPGFANRRVTVAITQEIELFVSSYLATITLINALLGGVVALVMHLFGMPNPVLWGVLAALLNFVPYLGPAVTAVVLTFVAVLTYSSLGQALLVPAAFLVITALEGYVITPMAVGSRLTLNPLVIFLSLVFWFWVWGVIGVLLTVPLLVCIKVIIKHVAGDDVARILE